MSWDYDPTNLNETTAQGRKNVVRMWVGDVDPTQRMTTRRLEDEEILYTIVRWNQQVLPAAVECGETLLSRLARTEIGTVSNVQNQRYDQIASNVERLRERLRGTICMEVTGQSLDEKRDVEADPDAVGSSFRRGQFDNPFANQPDAPGTVTTVDEDD